MSDQSHEVRREVLVRRAEVSDLGTLTELMHDFYAEAGYDLELQSAQSSFLGVLTAPALGAVWLAHRGQDAIGHAVLTVRYTMEHGGLSAYIDDLYVRPKFRRQGVAKSLLGALFADSRSRSCKFAYVEVGDTNEPARRLYESLGLHAVRDGRILASGAIPNPET